MQKPELLAPAGNREAFEAAIAAGADAVYLGGEGLNARRNADNFSTEDLRAACHDAHLRGRKVYLTANTLVFPGEMDDALALVANAAEAGVDAAIVQDVGLMSALRRRLPELELHASTQMNIRDEAGIEIARKLGASRVTLARELSIQRIAQLAQCGMELEVFVHGALCICQSGQCLLSSMIGGRSANRGVCAQPCRLPYKLLDASGQTLKAQGDYLLSPRDLMGIELLPQLIDAGVASLKIEGRMKSPEYVSTVTGVYRAALDRAWVDEGAYRVTPEEITTLGDAFNRGFSQAYLAGERGNDMMAYKRPNNRGVLVGRVAGFANGMTKVNATQPLEVGDLLEVWANKGRVTYEVDGGDDIRPGKVELHIRGAVAPGDRIFRVRSAQLAADVKERTKVGMKIPVKMSVRMVLGEPLEVSAFDERGNSGYAQGPIVEPARTKAVTRDDVIEHVGRMGSTPFVPEQWDVELSEGAGIGFSQLHKVRAAALEQLEEVAVGVAENDRRDIAAPLLDFSGVIDMSQMAAFATTIDFSDTDIACELGEFKPGASIGPKLYATNIEAIQTWAALGASFVWASPELTLHQLKLLCDDSPLPIGLVVRGRQELMVSDHCFLMAQGPCDMHCATCAHRAKERFYQDRKGYQFPVITDSKGRGHLYNGVPLDVVYTIDDLLNAGVRGFAVDITLMDAHQAEEELNRVRRKLKGKRVAKEEGATTGHLFRPVE